MQPIEEIDFNRDYVWIKIHNLPKEYINRANVEYIAAFEYLIDMVDSAPCVINHNLVFKFKVCFNLTKTLPQSFWLTIGKKDIWFGYKY